MEVYAITMYYRQNIFYIIYIYNKCGQSTQRTIHLTTLQDATFQTGSTHADKTAPPPAPRVMV
jgi:hypothetical protein